MGSFTCSPSRYAQSVIPSSPFIIHSRSLHHGKDRSLRSSEPGPSGPSIPRPGCEAVLHPRGCREYVLYTPTPPCNMIIHPSPTACAGLHFGLVGGLSGIPCHSEYLFRVPEGQGDSLGWQAFIYNGLQRIIGAPVDAVLFCTGWLVAPARFASTVSFHNQVRLCSEFGRQQLSTGRYRGTLQVPDYENER